MRGRGGVPPRRGYFFGLSFGALSPGPPPGPLVGAGSAPRRSRLKEPAAWPSSDAVTVLQPAASDVVSSFALHGPRLKSSGITTGLRPPHGVTVSAALPDVRSTPLTKSRSFSGTVRPWFAVRVPSVTGSLHWTE